MPKSEETVRIIFAMLCCVGIVAIGTAATLEIRRMRRGEALISPRHFRWRMISTTLWVFIFAVLAYATTVAWPERGDREAVIRMGNILGGCMALMMVAMVIFSVDLMVTLRKKLAHARRVSASNRESLNRELGRYQSTERKGREL